MADTPADDEPGPLAAGRGQVAEHRFGKGVTIVFTGHGAQRPGEARRGNRRQAHRIDDEMQVVAFATLACADGQRGFGLEGQACQVKETIHRRASCGADGLDPRFSLRTPTTGCFDRRRVTRAMVAAGSLPSASLVIRAATPSWKCWRRAAAPSQ